MWLSSTGRLSLPVRPPRPLPRQPRKLATDEELMEIEEILYGTSYFSPLLKSVAKRPNSDSIVILDDIEERDMFISKLESRFLYLAADARSVIRGWRPSYRDVLLGVRRKLGVQCSSKLCTADLEAEIFLHPNEYLSDHQKGDVSFPWDKQKSSKQNSSLGVNKWKAVTDAAWKIGAKGLESAFLKGGSALTAKTIYELLAKKLSGKMLIEAANYEIKKEIVKQVSISRVGDWLPLIWSQELGCLQLDRVWLVQHPDMLVFGVS
ncbi:hypothetical protein PR202_gb22468 [Eleusine coracana subsp. coracana]|uniref:Uncharacterized protein n=1 Tax=Eleusine coracana subsp. coracana TaxID=191504 RepID=A0AAV5FFS8_ELECO|nr:hypothetical protein PR202_gb22468 [Eleusine coracana subsp. coracana]